MFQFIYSLFFLILLIEIAVFLFLNLPVPKGWKQYFFEEVISNENIKKIIKIQIGICIISLFFYLDLTKTQTHYNHSKHKIRNASTLAGQLKREYLTSQIFKLQKNKYITFMLAYVFVMLIAFVSIKNAIYQKRRQHAEKLQILEARKDSKEVSQVSV